MLQDRLHGGWTCEALNAKPQTLSVGACQSLHRFAWWEPGSRQWCGSSTITRGPCLTLKVALHRSCCQVRRYPGLGAFGAFINSLHGSARKPETACSSWVLKMGTLLGVPAVTSNFMQDKFEPTLPVGRDGFDLPIVALSAKVTNRTKLSSAKSILRTARHQP